MHTRKLNRLKEYDYSQTGFYFVTICTKNRIHYFGEINNGQIILNRIGEIVNRQWLWLAQQYPFVRLDQHIVMPNHVHGILILDGELVGNGRDRSPPDSESNQKIKSLSELIGAFKTTSSKLIHESGLLEFKWAEIIL